MARALRWLHEPVGILPLVWLRVLFGLVMAAGMARLLAKGWVEALYLAPTYHFPYSGFEWVRPLPGVGLYLVFGALLGLALCIALGLAYRASMAAFFLLFTYVELLDKAYYLNHYYFVSLFSFLLIWLPLHHARAVDAWRQPARRRATVPRWIWLAVRLQLALVYFFAGIAKLKGDWLFHALPLRLWLPAHTDFPLLGPLFDQLWVAYAMSWAGALFDLTVPFLLFQRRARPVAYLAVLGFHGLTGLLFPIGMFPWLMVACTLVFFDEQDLAALRARLARGPRPAPPPARSGTVAARPTPRLAAVALFLVIQGLWPLRHWLYPGNVLWSEEGFRFAWNVMLVEKTGHVTFHLRDPQRGEEWAVYPSAYLTPPQEKQMSFQPDMIWQFAQHLEAEARAQGRAGVEVRAEAHVSLNGRPSRLLLDPTVDLTAQPNTLARKPWILPAP